MSRLGAQLERLRQQSGAARIAIDPEPMVASSAGAAATIEVDKLRRLLGLRLRSALVPPPIDGHLPGLELAPGLRYVERHLDLDPADADLHTGIAGFEQLDQRQLLHFDTETTGLSGGTGTRAFMIGAADWRDDGLRIRQLYLATMAGESAMLEVFASWLQSEHVLVSYNGRCFDAPLLATRYRLARMHNPLTALRHLDLLFPVRRRYRGVWENCRLATIERQLLAVLREDDLPGSEAPRAWRSYLTRGDARDLRRVLAHNDQDVISLAQLLRKLAIAAP